METLEVTGRSVEEAIEIALNQLGAERDQVAIDVLNPGRGGILGFGAEPARIKVTLTTPPTGLANVARITIDNLLRLMKVTGSSNLKSQEPDENGTIEVDLEGEDSGLLIGRKGETLRALQFVVNILVSRQAEGRVVLDVEGYKDRQFASLRAMAVRVADRVVSSGRSVILEPMAPSERRAIHMALSDHPSVETSSSGIGPDRKVTVAPRE
jgi:spoIIIJ-associated protein